MASGRPWGHEAGLCPCPPRNFRAQLLSHAHWWWWGRGRSGLGAVASPNTPSLIFYPREDLPRICTLHCLGNLALKVGDPLPQKGCSRLLLKRLSPRTFLLWHLYASFLSGLCARRTGPLGLGIIRGSSYPGPPCPGTGGLR